MKCLIIIAIVIVVLIIIGSMAGGGEQAGNRVNLLTEDNSSSKCWLEWEDGKIFHVRQYLQGDRSKNKVEMDQTYYRIEDGIIKVYSRASYTSVPAGTVVMIGRVEGNKIILTNKELAPFHSEYFQKLYGEMGGAHLVKGTKVREEVVAVIDESNRTITSTIGSCRKLAKYQGNPAEAGAAMIGYFFKWGSVGFNNFWNADDPPDAENRWEVAKRKL